MKIDDFAVGSVIEIKTSHPLHYSTKPVSPKSDDVAGSFGDMFNKLVSRVNDLQVDSESKAQQMIYAPETIDIHTVMIAQQKAEVSLFFAKAVRDEALRAYRELVNLR